MEMMKTIMVIVVVGFLASTATAKLHKVGDGQGWNQNVNYTQWAADQDFYAGEWLIFNFDKRYYNVLEVNETNFESCNDREFITNITRGGRDVFELQEARPYYFLTSGGYCYHGMKLAIVVQQELPLAPAVAPAPNSSPNAFTFCVKISIISTLVVSLALVIGLM